MDLSALYWTVLAPIWLMLSNAVRVSFHAIVTSEVYNLFLVRIVWLQLRIISGMILIDFDSFIVSVFWNKHSVDEIKINLIFLFSVKTLCKCSKNYKICTFMSLPRRFMGSELQLSMHDTWISRYGVILSSPYPTVWQFLGIVLFGWFQ